MKVEISFPVRIEFSEKEMNKFLSYGDKSVSDLTVSQFNQITSVIAESVKSRMIDEPHYVWEDCLEKVFKDC